MNIINIFMALNEKSVENQYTSHYTVLRYLILSNFYMFVDIIFILYLRFKNIDNCLKIALKRSHYLLILNIIV